MEITNPEREHQKRTTSKLKRELGSQILACLAEPTVEDIARNSDGSLWVKYRGKKWVKKEFEINDIQAENILRAIASSLGTTITPEFPVLDGELILDGSRVHGNLPPETRRPSFTIRKRPNTIFTLEQYIEQGALQQQHYAYLCNAVKDHKNIFVVGSTGSGKTTFVNALIHQVSILTPEDRIAIIEDTGEVQCAAPNTEHLFTTDTRSLADLVKETLRMRPDRIIIGEVRGEEALYLLEIWNTGHNGGIATAHADTASPQAGLERLEMLISRASAKLSNEFISRLIASTCNIIVCIQEFQGKRRINNITQVEGFKNGKYITTSID